MNTPEKAIRILGLALLIGFTSTVAAFYFDLPARMRAPASAAAPAPKPTVAPALQPATSGGQCPVFHGPGSAVTKTAAAAAEAGGGCCAKKPAAAAHACGMESAACDHGQVPGVSPAAPVKAGAAESRPAAQPKQESHAH